MSAQRYSLSLSPRSVDLLVAASNVQWNRAEFAKPIRQIDRMSIRTDKVRVCGEAGFVIRATSTEIIPKLEVFHLTVQPDVADAPDPRFLPTAYEDAGEMLAAFIGVAHQLLIATRRHTVPEWARHGVEDIVVEDLIIVRHYSGQQAFIAPDDSELGAVRVSRVREHLPWSDAEILSVRIL